MGSRHSNHKKIEPFTILKDGSCPVDLQSLKQLEVVLVIDELRVISFDKLSMKMPSSVAYDDLVNVHLSYLTHLMVK